MLEKNTAENILWVHFLTCYCNVSISLLMLTLIFGDHRQSIIQLYQASLGHFPQSGPQMLNKSDLPGSLTFSPLSLLSHLSHVTFLSPSPSSAPRLTLPLIRGGRARHWFEELPRSPGASQPGVVSGSTALTVAVRPPRHYLPLSIRSPAGTVLTWPGHLLPPSTAAVPAVPASLTPRESPSRLQEQIHPCLPHSHQR